MAQGAGERGGDDELVCDRTVLGALVNTTHTHLDGFGRVDTADAHAVGLRENLRNAELAGLELQTGHIEQGLEFDRRLAVTVGELLFQILQIGLVAGGGELAVCFQTQLVRIDVLDRNRRFDGQVDGHGHRLDVLFGLLVLLHGFGHHAYVQVEAHALDMAGLLVAQKVSGATQLQILHGHVETGAERRVLRDRGEPVVGLLGHRLGRVVQEVGVRAFTSTADAAAQLMKLAQAETVGMVDDQRVRVGYVKTRLDDRGAHEHVDVTMPEVADDLVKLLLTHLAVGDADVRFGHQRMDLVGDGRDVLHAIVHVEHLAAAQQFTAHRRGDLRVLVGSHKGQHRQPVFGRGGQRGHLANAGHGHLQRTRDRRGRQGQHVHIGAQCLQRFLVFHAETLLLVDDDEPQILERDLGVQQFVRADDHVHRAGPQALDGPVDLLGGLEPAHGRHIDREPFEPFAEGLVMLLDQQRGGHEHGHLLAVLHGLEGRAQRDLGFAEPHIAADQAIHRHGLFHVGFDLVDGGELVGGFLIGEGVFQLFLPWGVRAEREALGALAGGVQLDQVVGDLMDVLAGLGFGGRPVGAAELVELGSFGTDVFADLVELVGGDEQFVRRGAALGRRIFDDQVFASGFVGAGADGALAHFDEPADAVLLVHHVIAFFEFHQVDGLAPAFRRFGHGHG